MSSTDRYRVEDIEAASDVVVWCCDESPGFSPRRAQDRAFVGNIVQAMQAYASGALVNGNGSSIHIGLLRSGFS